MSKISNKLIFALSAFIIFGGIYSYFANGLGAQAADSSLVSSNPLQSQSPSPLATSGDKIAADTSFISALTSLNRIKIDKSLFNDASFNNLVDNTVTLEPSATGRENPFSPIAGDFASAPAPLVVTTAPAQVTSTSAVLNGTTNNTQGVTSVYFEFGISPLFGQFTPPAKQSLIGSFGSSISNLVPKTAYFYRAVAKINGALKYGDVIQFNTN